MKTIFSILIMLLFINVAPAQDFWDNASNVSGRTPSKKYINGLLKADQILIYNSTKNYKIAIAIQNQYKTSYYSFPPDTKSVFSLKYTNGYVTKTIIKLNEKDKYRLEGRKRFKLYYSNGKAQIKKY